VEIALPECVETTNLRQPALRVQVMDHHLLKVVLRLSVAVPKERRFLGFT
jgi:hypothetical protein